MATIAIGKGKERALPVAFNERSNLKYLVIERPEQFLSGMSWVINQQELPDAVRMDRADKLSALIKESFIRYWRRFVEIMDDNT